MKANYKTCDCVVLSSKPLINRLWRRNILPRNCEKFTGWSDFHRSLIVPILQPPTTILESCDHKWPSNTIVPTDCARYPSALSSLASTSLSLHLKPSFMFQTTNRQHVTRTDHSDGLWLRAKLKETHFISKQRPALGHSLRSLNLLNGCSSSSKSLVTGEIWDDGHHEKVREFIGFTSP